MSKLILAIANNETINYQNEEQLISDYSGLINRNGVSSVIVSVLIIIVLALIIYMIRSNKKNADSAASAQDKMLNTILDMIKQQNKLLDDKCNTLDGTNGKEKIVVKETNIIEMFVKTSNQLKNILNSLRDETSASRVGVYVFHNGNFSSHGLPFFKTSCISEVISKNGGVPKVINIQQNMPLEMFDDTIKVLYNNGYECITNVDESTDIYPYYTGIMKSNGVEASIGAAIYDSDNNILGVVIVDFSHTITKEESKKYIDITISKAPFMAPILEYSKDNK